MIAPARDQPQNAIDHFMGMRSDYEKHRDSRFTRKITGVAPMGSHADYHTRNDYQYFRAVEISRAIDREDVVVGQGVDRFCDNVFQSGFEFDPNTGDQSLDDELKARFTEWETSPALCDTAGERTYRQMSYDVFRASIIDGDIFGLPTTSGHLEMLENHRCRSSSQNKRKNVVNGVELNEHRRRMQFFFTREEVNAHTSSIKWSDVEARDAYDSDGNKTVFQWYMPKRISQTRGVTALAPIIDTTIQHDDINFATLVKQQMASCFAIIHERPYQAKPGTGSRGAGTTDGQQTDNPAHDWERATEYNAPGMRVLGQPGETIKGFSPNIPSQEYFDHMHLVLTYIAINLKVPLVVLMLDSSETNFSGFRGALQQARISWMMYQQRFCERWNCEVAKWQIRRWLDEDPAMRSASMKSGVSIFNHQWQKPGWDYIEPHKDAQGDVTQLANGLTSHRRIQALRGRSEEVIHKEIIADNARRIRAALSEADLINKEYPEAEIHWRELMPMPLPDNVQLNAADDIDPGAKAKPEKKKVNSPTVNNQQQQSFLRN